MPSSRSTKMFVPNNLPLSSYFADTRTLSAYFGTVYFAIMIQGRYMSTVTEASAVPPTTSQPVAFATVLSAWQVGTSIFAVLFVLVPRVVPSLSKYVSPTQISRRPATARAWGSAAVLAMLSHLAQIVAFFSWWCAQDSSTTPLRNQDASSSSPSVFGALYWDVNLLLLPAVVLLVCIAKAVKGTATGWWELCGGTNFYFTRQETLRMNDQQGTFTGDVELGNVAATAAAATAATAATAAVRPQMNASRSYLP
ncbi:hypothetical protein MKZ38_000064 [Zalerion maritima]|uniref:Uncharacterized protein n=1 Tax=Zalerion maritima TaxID=339359 RepID=A0AAD5RFS6_9PEZI|nr:hypothetical protein MKZ38_000064 [Zalerion maritima]